ncbi:MAG: hypothetical protein FOGNACKC_06067 [Anaerolineae bacterium]|nr:hypothetical protein [Anaerolineae bacterium]
MRANKSETYRTQGFVLGVTTGAIIGAVAGGSMLLLMAYGLPLALSVFFGFSLIFAAFGSFMGWLFDVDTRQRQISRPPLLPNTAQSTQQRTKTQPLSMPF